MGSGCCTARTHRPSSRGRLGRPPCTPDRGFESSVCFEFVLGCGMRRWSVSWSPSTVHRLSLPLLCACPPCAEPTDPAGEGSFLGSPFCSIGQGVCVHASAMPFCLLWPCSVLGARQHESSSFVLSQDCCGFWDPWVFRGNFRVICSSSVKNATGSSVGLSVRVDLNSVSSCSPWGRRAISCGCVFSLSQQRIHFQVPVFTPQLNLLTCV